MLTLAVADNRWVGKRVIVAASGPSLRPEVAEVCDGETVVCINDAYKIFPHAELLYSCDASWWEVNKYCAGFAGERWTSHSLAPKNDKRNFPHREDFNIIAGRAGNGFSRDPRFINYGNNSGFQGVNLAILFGTKEIILVGFDMRVVENQSHFFGNHKTPLRDGHAFGMWIAEFARAAKNLQPGVEIINATPNSALDCFPKLTLQEALGRKVGLKQRPEVEVVAADD